MGNLQEDLFALHNVHDFVVDLLLVVRAWVRDAQWLFRYGVRDLDYHPLHCHSALTVLVLRRIEANRVPKDGLLVRRLELL